MIFALYFALVESTFAVLIQHLKESGGVDVFAP